jgi:hypothetical protein
MKWRLSSLATATATAIAIAGAGCGDLDSTELATEEPISEVQSALFYGWQDVENPPVWAKYTVAMGLAKDTTTYTWYNDGWLCEGIASHLCTYQHQYSAPLNRWDEIRGVSLNHKNWVYTWYRDKTYSVGDPFNLTSRAPKKAFSTVHRMDDLVDAFSITLNLGFATSTRWYYYWKMYSPTSPGGFIYVRTVGTESDADHYDDDQEVTVSRVHGDIVGIDYNQETGRIWTWYANGQRNSSNTTLNLAFD